MQRCELGGCFRQPIENAHIKGKGAGGSNKKHNKIKLCVYHHRSAKKSLHQMGTWAFAELHGLTERFQKAFEIEKQLEQEKRDTYFKKFRDRQLESRKRICPTCKRSWYKGVIKGD